MAKRSAIAKGGLTVILACTRTCRLISAYVTPYFRQPFFFLMLPAILLVDDDSTTNYLNRRLLERLNICDEVLVAPNGQQALELLQTHCSFKEGTCPALVLLDVNMPVMNGFEFLEAFMQAPARQSIVIIMLTSSQLDADLVMAQHLPVADFLHKPLTREKITDVLSRYFD
jgi:CheY-like chemotaxis protein